MRRIFLKHCTALAASLAGARILAVEPDARGSPGLPREMLLVVPFAPGGANDIVTRTVAQEMQRVSGQTVVVENRAGAGGSIGTAFVVRSPADGSVLLMGGGGTTIANKLIAGLSYDPLRDLTPVAFIGGSPVALLVAEPSPYKDVTDLVKDAKAHPGAISYGHGGIGLPSEHLVAEMFNARAGIKTGSVPYKGGSAAMNDLIGGQVQFAFTNLANAMPLIRGGRLRAIAVATKDRTGLLPGVPTLAERGYPGFDVLGWWGLLGPKNMAPATVRRINEQVTAVLNTSAVQERLASFAATTRPMTSEQFASFYASEARLYGGIIDEIGLKPE